MKTLNTAVCVPWSVFFIEIEHKWMQTVRHRDTKAFNNILVIK